MHSAAVSAERASISLVARVVRDVVAWLARTVRGSDLVVGEGILVLVSTGQIVLVEFAGEE